MGQGSHLRRHHQRHRTLQTTTNSCNAACSASHRPHIHNNDNNHFSNPPTLETNHCHQRCRYPTVPRNWTPRHVEQSCYRRLCGTSSTLVWLAGPRHRIGQIWRPPGKQWKPLAPLAKECWHTPANAVTVDDGALETTYVDRGTTSTALYFALAQLQETCAICRLPICKNFSRSSCSWSGRFPASALNLRGGNQLHRHPNQAAWWTSECHGLGY